MISRPSSFQINMLLIIVSVDAGLQAGPNSGVEARGRGGLRAAEEAGLPLILSSFIPSRSIITRSGRGYPPRLWSVYQLLSAARPRMTGWLSWDWWGDVTAAWAKPNQMSGRISHPPATCGGGTDCDACHLSHPVLACTLAWRNRKWWFHQLKDSHGWRF